MMATVVAALANVVVVAVAADMMTLPAVAHGMAAPLAANMVVILSAVLAVLQ